MASGLWRAISSTIPSWISRSREGRGARACVRMTPHSIRDGEAEPPPRTTPYPVTAVPGSIPRTIIRERKLRLPLPPQFPLSGELLLVYVEVRPHLLHVVEIVEILEQLEQSFGIFSGDGHRVLRNHGKL